MMRRSENKRNQQCVCVCVCVMRQRTCWAGSATTGANEPRLNRLLTCDCPPAHAAHQAATHTHAHARKGGQGRRCEGLVTEQKLAREHTHTSYTCTHTHTPVSASVVSSMLVFNSDGAACSKNEGGRAGAALGWAHTQFTM